MNHCGLTAGQSTGPLVTKHATQEYPDPRQPMTNPVSEMVYFDTGSISAIRPFRHPVVAQVSQHSTETVPTPVLDPSKYKLASGFSSLLGFYAWTLTTTVVSDYTQTPRLLANNAMYVRRQLKVTDNSRD